MEALTNAAQENLKQKQTLILEMQENTFQETQGHYVKLMKEPLESYERLFSENYLTKLETLLASEDLQSLEHVGTQATLEFYSKVIKTFSEIEALVGKKEERVKIEKFKQLLYTFTQFFITLDKMESVRWKLQWTLTQSSVEKVEIVNEMQNLSIGDDKR